MNARRAALAASLWMVGIATLAWAADEPWVASARNARKANPVATDPKAIAAGKELYADQCLSCHGANGTGNGPAAKDLERAPTDLTRASVLDQTDGALFWKITTGKKPMPAFETMATETERWQIILYMRSLAPKTSTSQAASKPAK